jgi:hypothetical protein
MWESFYDVRRLPEPQRRIFAALEASLPAFVARLLAHRPATLHGRRLGEALSSDDRRAERLGELFSRWSDRLPLMAKAPPTLAFAVLGQARLDGKLSPERESDLLAGLLRHWAWRSTVDVGEVCAVVSDRSRRRAPAVLTPASAVLHATVH